MSRSSFRAMFAGIITALFLLAGCAQADTATAVTASARTPQHVNLTYASLNVLKSDPGWKVTHDLRAANDRAQIIGLQEVRPGRPAVARVHRFRRRGDVAGYTPRGGAVEVSILWDQHRFSKLPGHGWVKTYHGKRFVSPNRYISWQPLIDHKTGLKFLVINTHAINGYWKCCKSAPAYRDASAKAHWKEAVALTRHFNAEDKYDVILFVGDFNAKLTDYRAWFYPGPMLDGYYVFDAAPRSIDHLIYTKSSRDHVYRERRWNYYHVYSDHPLALRRIGLKNLPRS